MEFDPDQAWYPGSPLELTVLSQGSTITKKVALARIFSHKLAVVSVMNDGRSDTIASCQAMLYPIHPQPLKPGISG